MAESHSPAALKLTEDEVDDVLYLARANETADLPAFLAELSQSQAYAGRAAAADILVAAVDAESGNSALHYAAANGHTDILEVVRNTLTSAASSPEAAKESYKDYVNLKNAAGNTALHWAALNGHLPAVKTLVALGADATILNAAGHDAVFEAEQNGKNDVVGWLLVEGGALDTVVGALKEEESAGASKNGDQEDKGEDVEMKMSMGDTSEAAAGVEKGVENLSVDDVAKSKKESG